MKHRIELTEEQAKALFDEITEGHRYATSANTWLNANLPHILKTEFVVTDEMAEEFYQKLGPLSFKRVLQQFAHAYINSPAEAAPADKVPEIFEAHGMEWYRHTPGDPMPCDGEIEIKWLTYEDEGGYRDLVRLAKTFDWSKDDPVPIIGWRPADAPAKLPRPEQQPQDEVQALKARVLKLEGALEHETKLRETYEQACAIWEKNASTPTLRPIAEMPDAVPEGCVRLSGTIFSDGVLGGFSHHMHAMDTHFLDIRLPAPPDTDEELRREWEKLFSHSDALKQIRESLTEEQVSISFQAYKAGRAKEGAR